ncbi:hypothetical protein BJ742DRAFT_786604, partial [Cladochytrium replicatum]
MGAHTTAQTAGSDLTSSSNSSSSLCISETFHDGGSLSVGIAVTHHNAKTLMTHPNLLVKPPRLVIAPSNPATIVSEAFVKQFSVGETESENEGLERESRNSSPLKAKSGASGERLESIPSPKKAGMVFTKDDRDAESVSNTLFKLSIGTPSRVERKGAQTSNRGSLSSKHSREKGSGNHCENEDATSDAEATFRVRQIHTRSLRSLFANARGNEESAREPEGRNFLSHIHGVIDGAYIVTSVTKTISVRLPFIVVVDNGSGEDDPTIAAPFDIALGADWLQAVLVRPKSFEKPEKGSCVAEWKLREQDSNTSREALSKLGLGNGSPTPYLCSADFLRTVKITTCVWCSKAFPRYRCGRCLSPKVRYCGRVCQARDFTRGTKHIADCEPCWKRTEN